MCLQVCKQVQPLPDFPQTSRTWHWFAHLFTLAQLVHSGAACSHWRRIRRLKVRDEDRTKAGQISGGVCMNCSLTQLMLPGGFLWILLSSSARTSPVQLPYHSGRSWFWTYQMVEFDRSQEAIYCFRRPQMPPPPGKRTSWGYFLQKWIQKRI